MISNFKTLLLLCNNELTNCEYGERRTIFIKQEWANLKQWMKDHKKINFSEEIGINYCDEVLGWHLISNQMDSKTKLRLRAVRMLISYQKKGYFEFRSPRVEHIYCGEFGKTIESYLSHLTNTQKLTAATIKNKEHYLYDFYSYFSPLSTMSLNSLNIDKIELFFSSNGYSPASRHNCASTIRLFLRYVFDIGVTNKDLSIIVLPDNYDKKCKLPTTYKENEIRAMIASVDRASPIGKRDYLILLLATEYGWRAKDIVNFRFDQIDWDKNTINFEQSKTSVPIEYPLLASIGNAIADYLKHGRPKSESE
jgi:hypothetical protein